MTRPRRMMTCLFAAALLGIAFAGFGVSQLQAQPKAKADKTAVAVVNVAELINKCDKNQAFQAEIQKRNGRLQQEAKEKQDKINLMKLDLDAIPNAQDRAKKEREIIEAIAEFRAWQQIQQEVLVRDQRLNLIELYGDIDKTVAVVAEREGYDLVLFSTPTPDFEQLNPEQLLQVIGNRRVIYQTDKVDLTKVVLEQMNLDHLNDGN
ncbi:MAG: OmpH family outer membrane protein [Phycisphaeraceae bacterium]